MSQNTFAYHGLLQQATRARTAARAWKRVAKKHRHTLKELKIATSDKLVPARVDVDLFDDMYDFFQRLALMGRSDWRLADERAPGVTCECGTWYEPEDAEECPFCHFQRLLKEFDEGGADASQDMEYQAEAAVERRMAQQEGGDDE